MKYLTEDQVAECWKILDGSQYEKEHIGGGKSFYSEKKDSLFLFKPRETIQNLADGVKTGVYIETEACKTYEFDVSIDEIKSIIDNF